MSEHFHDHDHDSDTEGHYIHIGGKRLHGNKDVRPYSVPKENEEQHRLDNIQVMFKAHFGDTVLAPIPPDPHKILDLGTGSGIWAVEVAKRYPTAEVIGIDSSPVHRSDAPENCEFTVGDINKALAQFEDESFDFVHSRMLMSGVDKEQWPEFIAEICRVLKPGGWAQCTESSLPLWEEGGIPEDSNYLKYRKMMEKVIEKNQYLLGGEHIDKRFSDMGFKYIKVIDKDIDIGTWRGSQDLKLVRGRVAAMSVYGEPIAALGMALEEDFPDIEERKIFGELVQKEFMTSNYPLYVKMHAVIARKPLHLPVPDLSEWNKNFGTGTPSGYMTPVEHDVTPC